MWKYRHEEAISKCLKTPPAPYKSSNQKKVPRRLVRRSFHEDLRRTPSRTRRSIRKLSVPAALGLVELRQRSREHQPPFCSLVFRDFLRLGFPRNSVSLVWTFEASHTLLDLVVDHGVFTGEIRRLQGADCSQCAAGTTNDTYWIGRSEEIP